LPRSRTVCRRRMPEMFVVTSQGVRHAAGCSVPDHTISTPPENTSVAPACWVRGLAARIQRYTTWERGLPARLQRYATWVRRRPARMPGARASSLPQRYAPPGCAGVQPACWERGRLARIQRYATWVCGLPARLRRYATWVRRRPARMLGARASRPHTAIRHLGMRASSPPPAICHVGARASSPHAGSAGFQPAYDAPPESAGFQPASSDMPRGCAGFQPACRVHRHCARIQRYTPSPLHRLGARASSPHAGCTGIAPAYSDTLHHPCTVWERGLPACLSDTPRLGAQASRPHAGCAGVSPAYSDAPPGYAGFQPAYRDTPPGCAGFQPAYRDTPPGCAGVSPACWVRGLPARIQRYTPSPLHRMGARASSPHAGCTGIAPAYSDTPHHPCTAWVRGRLARMPRAEGHTWQRQWVLDHALTS